MHRVITTSADDVAPVICARRIRIRGIVQGVGFRPFVFRIASTHRLTGWVLNGADGVEIHVEGDSPALDAFAVELTAAAPAAAAIASVDSAPASCLGHTAFTIRESEVAVHPTARISPDLPVCDACLRELFDPGDRRYGYPYINCTACGPRYSVIESLPYDRRRTTMAAWPMCEACSRDYHDASDRRFHAQPLACAACGPHVRLEHGHDRGRIDAEAIAATAVLLASGAIVAIKGIGGYHVACDAASPDAVNLLRSRKFRKERPFAVMVRDLQTAHAVVKLSPAEADWLQAAARPIVIAPACRLFEHVAPGNDDLGVMLPYAPVHHLLFAAGAPAVLVMTSGNRPGDPIACEDDDARSRLSGIADAILVGDRPIARRLDDSVAKTGREGPTLLRRGRGLAPGIVARFPDRGPILAVGADLKNAPLLVVGGDALLAPHVGDLEHYAALRAFDRTLRDLTQMYDIDSRELLVVHDAHPDYASTARALDWPAARHEAVQHHRAHVASVMAEHNGFDTRVIGVAFDGTGYGDDGTIWGGEFFAGSIGEGFTRVAHLRPAWLIGGDAAARLPIQAAAGFVGDLGGTVDLTAPPFEFPKRYQDARQLLSAGVRVLPTTSAGRLFDAAAALIGFTRAVTFEGQAAMWLEHLARDGNVRWFCPVRYADGVLDYRPALSAIIDARRRGEEPGRIARAFHRGLARGMADAIVELADVHGVTNVAMSGGVFQNTLLVSDLLEFLAPSRLRVAMNRIVPPNDGGISLGQAALAAVSAGNASCG